MIKRPHWIYSQIWLIGCFVAFVLGVNRKVEISVYSAANPGRLLAIEITPIFVSVSRIRNLQSQ